MLGLLDFILNLAGLLLWLNWRASGFDPLALATPATLAGTLRRTSKTPLKNWHFPGMITGLLFLRALFYWQIGSAVGWVASLNLGVIAVSFRSDYFWRMFLFSVLSFCATLAVFYLWLLLLSLLKPDKAEMDPFHKLVRQHLGSVDHLPRWAKGLLPLLAGGGLWWLLSWPLAYWGLIPHPVSATHRVELAFVIGLGTYLVWKYLIVAVLLLYVAGSYIYFGNHPFWSYIHAIARVMLAPLRWLPLRIGKVDLAPFLGIALALIISLLVEGNFPFPLMDHSLKITGWRSVPGLIQLYQHLPL